MASAAWRRPANFCLPLSLKRRAYQHLMAVTAGMKAWHLGVAGVASVVSQAMGYVVMAALFMTKPTKWRAAWRQRRRKAYLSS